MGQDKLLT